MAKKVLIIEDDEIVASAYGLTLNKEGYEVKLAADGLIGLKEASAWSPDIILLDLLMPNMGGIDFLKAYDVKQHPGTKVLVFTNMSAPSTVDAAAQLGAVKYLTKSDYTPKEITQMLHDELS